MRAYDRSFEHDCLLGKWWATLVASKEITLILTEQAIALTPFLAVFQPPSVLLFDADDEGIRLAIWFSPLFSGAAVGLWLRQDARRTKAAYRAVHEAIEFALTQWPTLVGITRLYDVARLHAHFGFRWAGEVPNLFDGHPAFVSYLTRPLYDKRRKERRASA